MAYVNHVFNDVMEVEEFISNHDNAYADTMREEYTEGFNGCTSHEDAVSRAAAGYAEVVPRCKEGIESVIKANGIGATNRRARVRAVAGSTPNVTRAMLGLPDSMHKYVKAAGSAPVLRMAYDMSKACDVSTEECIQWGINAMALVKAADMRGVPIELWAVMATDNMRTDGATAVCEICVKCAGQSLNVSKAAFWLAHPAAHRGIGFAIRERLTSLYTKPHSGYGASHSQRSGNREQLRSWYKERGFVYVSGYDFYDGKTVEEIAKELF